MHGETLRALEEDQMRLLTLLAVVNVGAGFSLIAQQRAGGTSQPRVLHFAIPSVA